MRSAVSIATGSASMASVESALDQVQQLRDRLAMLEKRRDDLMSLLHHLEDFTLTYHNHAQGIRSRFPEVRLAGRLADQLTSCVTGTASYAAGDQLTQMTRGLDLKLESVAADLRVAQRRVEEIEAGVNFYV